MPDDEPNSASVGFEIHMLASSHDTTFTMLEEGENDMTRIGLYIHFQARKLNTNQFNNGHQGDPNTHPTRKRITKKTSKHDIPRHGYDNTNGAKPNKPLRKGIHRVNQETRHLINTTCPTMSNTTSGQGSEPSQQRGGSNA